MRIDKKRLIPEDKGRVVVGFLESFFARYVEYDFTASLEEKLDRISNNEINWKEVLQEFWIGFIGAVNEIKDLTHHPGARRAQRSARAAYLPGARRRRRRAAMPAMRHRQTIAESGTLRRLHRLLELSGMHFHSADDAGRRRRPDGTKVLGVDPVTGLEVTRSRRAFRDLSATGRASEAEGPRRARKPRNRRSPSAPACRRASRPRTSISTRRSRCSRCRAKWAYRRKTASRSWPASDASGLTSNTARSTRAWNTATTC